MSRDLPGILMKDDKQTYRAELYIPERVERHINAYLVHVALMH